MPAQQGDLVDVPSLIRAYYTGRPDPEQTEQRIAFGTSGHRGSSLRASFNEPHLIAIAEAVARYRSEEGIRGPLFLGADSHALSEPAKATVLEVLAAHGIDVFIDSADRFTPTPALSLAIVEANRGRSGALADGLAITPSHNPPEDGGIKYNPPSGGPAPGEVTSRIERQANALLRKNNAGVQRMAFDRALQAPTTYRYDYLRHYVEALPRVLDVDVLRGAALRVAVDPLGSAALSYWEPIGEALGLDLTVVSDAVDPRFAFMTLDWDGRIRMDCSSRYAMEPVVALRDRFDLGLATDTDADRHGIVTREAGLLPPNDYLAVAIGHLFAHRPGWGSGAGIAKSVVTSGLIDRIARDLGRPLLEMPVGFKHFVEPLQSGECGFVGEESAGASFLCHDGTVWTTDKDGILLCLLAVEITAQAGEDLGAVYRRWTSRLGTPHFARIDVSASREIRERLGALGESDVTLETLAGEPIEAIRTHALGNAEPFGGVKIVTRNGWFVARPSGTEALYKIYAESFLGEDHLTRIQDEAQDFVAKVIA